MIVIKSDMPISCNGCDMKYYTVYRIDLHSKLVFRLCIYCKDDLIKQLIEVKK